MGISEVAGPIYAFTKREGIQFGRNASIFGEYMLGKKIDLTFGIGYFDTREFRRSYLIGYTIPQFSEIFITHEYLIVPFGFQYKISSFFINPGIGMGFSIHHSGRDDQYEFSSTPINSNQKDYPNSLYYSVTLPLTLNLGTVIDLKKVNFILGIKGYYSLTPISDSSFYSGHYFGAGLLTGIKF